MITFPPKGNEINLFIGEADISFLEIVDDLPWKETKSTDIFTLLVELGVFTSKSQAKKNWQGPALEDGFNLIQSIGKKRLSLLIFKTIDKTAKLV